MGRELKRVPLDFNWPLNETWIGFVNPHYDACHTCTHCGSLGYSPEAKVLYDQWYGNAPFDPASKGSQPFKPDHPKVRAFAERQCERTPDYYGSGERAIVREAERLCELYNKCWSHHLDADDVKALIDGNRLWDFTHTWTQGEGWKPKDPFVIPTPTEVNDWSICGMGHDSLNCWKCVNAACERLGVPSNCSHCEGHGSIWDSPEAKIKAEEWVQEEPPVGEGYQLWETVSEGSPISPVFVTMHELADWLATSEDYAWKENDKGTTYEQWLKFIVGPGWSPSMIVSSEGVQTGVQAYS